MPAVLTRTSMAQACAGGASSRCYIEPLTESPTPPALKAGVSRRAGRSSEFRFDQRNQVAIAAAASAPLLIQRTSDTMWSVCCAELSLESCAQVGSFESRVQ